MDVDWVAFKEWLSRKYAKSHVPSTLSYCKRYNHVIWGDIRDIEKISPKSKNHVVKALIILSKYLGIHEEFKTSLKNYCVKLYSPDAFSAFMRVYSNQFSNLTEWLKQASGVLRQSEQLYLEFMSLTGLRKEEGIVSFNKIIELAKQGNLSEYYNEEKGLLEHFKYKEEFLRRTKNVYISIVPKDLVLSISNSELISYDGLRKRLMRAKLPCRINEQRDYFGTFMVRNGLIKEEVDLLQGRIPPSIFIRHYWSQSFKELRDRTLEALEKLNQA